jgi:kinetochore protein Spc24
MEEERSEYPELLKSTVDNFEIDEDVQTFDRIDESKKRLREKRERKLDESRDVLKSLSRRLELAKQSAEESKNSAAQKEAAEETMRLEREKFSLAKSINDLESDYASNYATLEKLKDEQEYLNNQDVEETVSPYVEDSTILKLKLYRSLGIWFEGEDENIESTNKALVQSTQTSNVHMIHLDQKYSNHFVANYLWERL